MKKRFLTRLNVILGIMSLGLAGCHSTKKAAAPEASAEPMVKYGVPEVVALYGVPVEGVDFPAPPQQMPAPASSDTLPAPEKREQPEQPMTKYGIPNPRI